MESAKLYFIEIKFAFEEVSEGEEWKMDRIFYRVLYPHIAPPLQMKENNQRNEVANVVRKLYREIQEQPA